MGGQIITLGERCLIRTPFLSQQATRILGLNPGLPRRVSVSPTCPLVRLCLCFETSSEDDLAQCRWTNKEVGQGPAPVQAAPSRVMSNSYQSTHRGPGTIGKGHLRDHAAILLVPLLHRRETVIETLPRAGGSERNFRAKPNQALTGDAQLGPIDETQDDTGLWLPAGDSEPEDPDLVRTKATMASWCEKTKQELRSDEQVAGRRGKH